MVAGFLGRHPEFELEPLEGLLQPPLSRTVRGPGFVRIFPAGDHDGFSLHVLRRRSR